MKNTKTGILILITSFVAVVIQLLSIGIGGYYYAVQHATNGEPSFALKKGRVYINDDIYSLSTYDFPYNYIILPFMGLFMIVFIIFLIKLFKQDRVKILALRPFNGQIFGKLLAVFIPVWLIYFIALEYLPAFQTEHILQLPSNTFAALLMFLGAAVFIPIYEEFIFRGLLYTYYAEKNDVPNAIIVSSFLFSVVHIHYGLALMFVIFVMGLFLGMARKVTNSIYPPILFHVSNNLMAALLGS